MIKLDTQIDSNGIATIGTTTIDVGTLLAHASKRCIEPTHKPGERLATSNLTDAELIHLLVHIVASTRTSGPNCIVLRNGGKTAIITPIDNGQHEVIIATSVALRSSSLSWYDTSLSALRFAYEAIGLASPNL